MRRSVYITLLIPLCFPGTMMDVIIIHIVILFKVETRTVATDVMSAASNLTDPSRSRRAKPSDFSNKRNAELLFYFVRSSAVERSMIRSVFQNADLTCRKLTGSRRMRDGDFSSEFPIDAFIATENGYLLPLLNAAFRNRQGPFLLHA